MMVEKTNRPSLKNIHLPNSTPQQEKELAQGMVRVNHLYRSALKVAVAQMEILDEEFATLNDRSPIHHIEYRIKTLDSIVEKLQRRGPSPLTTSTPMCRTWRASASSATT